MILSPLSSSPYSSLCANLFQANSFASNVLTIIDAGFSSGKLCLVSFVCVRDVPASIFGQDFGLRQDSSSTHVAQGL